MRKKIDMTGWKMWEHGVPESLIEVIDENLTYKQEHNLEYKTDSYWNCKCKCGKEKVIQGYELRKGHTLSCGCYKGKRLAQYRPTLNGSTTNKKNLVGKRYGNLTVIKDSGQRTPNKGEVLWLCQCDCGNTILVKTSHLEYKNGTELHTTSCGCILSKGEERIKRILKKSNIIFEIQKTYPDLCLKKKLRYDFYINNNFLLEYDGEQHYKEWNIGNETLAQRQEKDKIKNEYAKSHNIPLKRIPYWDYDKITLDNIMSDKWLVNN